MTLLKLAFSPNTVKRSTKVALIVGTVLLAINQGDAILAGSGFDWIKAVLTYCVPYCVSTYASVSTALEKS